jgi:type 1 glutamine amidotransferase
VIFSLQLLSAAALLQGDTVAGIPYVKLESRAATRSAMMDVISPQVEHWGAWYQCTPFPYAGHGLGDLATPHGPEVELARMRAGEALDLEAEYKGKKGTQAKWIKIGATVGDRIDLDTWEDPELSDLVTGYLYTTIESPNDRVVNCTLGSDDGIRLWLNGKLIHDKDVARGLNPLEDSIVLRLKEGTNDLLAKIVDGLGGWEFQLLTRPALDIRQEVELDHLLDRDFPVSRQRAHYTVTTLPVPQDLVLEVGGLTILPDGTPMVSTRRGDVFTVENAYGVPPLAAKFVPFAQGLHESLGLEWRATNDGLSLYTMQRGELTRLVDEDGDGRADLYESFCNDWGVSGNYHEFAFGPKFDQDGNAWVTLNVGFCGSLGKATVPWRGWALKITPMGEVLPVCAGLRSPNGIGMWKDGEMFYVDNQGDYVATNRLSHLAQGSFQGHPAGLRWREDFNSETDEWPKPQPASIWFPYRKMGQSAADIVLDTTGGSFGPFDEQFFVGDQMNGTVMRVELEQVNGHYQGACFPFIEHLDSGVNRMAFAPDGSMFVGQTDRGWGSIGKKSYGLQRVAWNGSMPFEILRMNAREDGFELTFTADIEPESAADPASYQLTSYTYEYHAAYGSPELDTETVKVSSVEVISKRRVRLHLGEMRKGFVHELNAQGVLDANGEGLVHSMAYYTLIEVPEVSISDFTPPKERLLFLTHSAGYEHAAIHRDSPEKLSAAETGLVEAAGDRYEVVATKDCSLINAKSLESFDAVMFYTTGMLPIEEARVDELLDWIAEGGAFVGVHCATDTFPAYAPFIDMIGGHFAGHPWSMPVTLVVEDGNHPSTKHLGKEWSLLEEVYQFETFHRYPLHGLLHLSGKKADLSKGARPDSDYVNAWCKPYGEGRVFYTALGHYSQAWSDPTFRTHLLGGVQWAIHGPNTPVPAPAEAIVLLKDSNLSSWTHADKRAPEWAAEDAFATVTPGTGNLFSKELFGDALFHIEFSPSVEAQGVTGQARGNSGVYLMGQYELQVLDSYGLKPEMGDCGSIYGVALPLEAPYRRAGVWSYYDIEFRAPRFDSEGKKTENARITAWLNGRLIHDDVEVPGPTAASWRRDEFPLGPLMLQEHGNKVNYRNVWALKR